MRVAFGKVKITPKNYIGIPLSGYTRKKKCDGKLDDLYAHAVLIEVDYLKNLKKRILFISTDLLKLPMVYTDYVKEKIFKKYRIPKGQILIHATHTHAAPDLNGEFAYPGGIIAMIKGILFGIPHDKYLVEIAMKIEKLVGFLINNLKLCKLAWKKEKIEEDIIINRRHPERRSKFHLGIIAFKSLNNKKLLGFIVNYACHGTTLSNENFKISADYIGRLIYRIEELTNNEVNAVYFNGPSGDINPITTCGNDFDNLKKDYSILYEQKGTYKDTIRIGYFLGEKALKLANSIKDSEYIENCEIKVYEKIFSIPVKDYNKYFNLNLFQNRLLYLIKKYVFLPILLAKPTPNFPSIALKRKGLKINAYSIIQVFQIKTNKGILFITGVPSEVFENIGKKIFDITPSGFENQFIFQNSNDWVGYLFPIDEYTKGGYEGLPTFLPLSGIYTEIEVLKLYNEIKRSINQYHY
ncbi:MAG: hypothetical protein ACTSQO_02795 [Candidatus Helarchaeota archaeon]